MYERISTLAYYSAAALKINTPWSFAWYLDQRTWSELAARYGAPPSPRGPLAPADGFEMRASARAWFAPRRPDIRAAARGREGYQ